MPIQEKSSRINTAETSIDTVHYQDAKVRIPCVKGKPPCSRRVTSKLNYHVMHNEIAIKIYSKLIDEDEFRFVIVERRMPFAAT